MRSFALSFLAALMLALPLNAEAFYLFSETGIRSAGMGGAAAFVPRDPMAVIYNPVAIASLEGLGVSMGMRYTWLNQAISTLATTIKTPIGGFGFGLIWDTSLLEKEDFNKYYVNGEEFSASVNDIAATLNFARPIWRRISAGIALKMAYSSVFDGAATMIAFAGDIGASMSLNVFNKSDAGDLTLSLFAKNIGPSVQYVDGETKTPMGESVGSGMTFVLNASEQVRILNGALFTVDVEVPIERPDLRIPLVLRLGAEAFNNPNNVFTPRIGVSFDVNKGTFSENMTIALGGSFGLNLSGYRIGLDAAVYSTPALFSRFILNGALGLTFRQSLTRFYNVFPDLHAFPTALVAVNDKFVGKKPMDARTSQEIPLSILSVGAVRGEGTEVAKKRGFTDRLTGLIRDKVTNTDVFALYAPGTRHPSESRNMRESDIDVTFGATLAIEGELVTLRMAFTDVKTKRSVIEYAITKTISIDRDGLPFDRLKVVMQNGRAVILNDAAVDEENVSDDLALLESLSDDAAAWIMTSFIDAVSGTIIVDSDIPGSTIYVNGVKAGEVPAGGQKATIRAVKGNTIVSIMKPRTATYTSSLMKIEAGREYSVRARMAGIPFTVNVNFQSFPQGLAFEFTSTNTVKGKTPFDRKNVAPGEYSYSIVDKRGNRHERAFPVYDDINYHITEVFEYSDAFRTMNTNFWRRLKSDKITLGTTGALTFKGETSDAVVAGTGVRSPLFIRNAQTTVDATIAMSYENRGTIYVGFVDSDQHGYLARVRPKEVAKQDFGQGFGAMARAMSVDVAELKARVRVTINDSSIASIYVNDTLLTSERIVMNDEMRVVIFMDDASPGVPVDLSVESLTIENM